ncbi:eukaryotic aspartyl protease family protein [Striga asiatica]|uniref:Eukaryotic aspartyl protease family protein n=1 Tax=Striga asiatica TaxID=4170 RepID=A0A5A7RJT9_STRAF|nr:eukaryotic aspartyl protease family protein [Striga asiatica]
MIGFSHSRACRYRPYMFMVADTGSSLTWVHCELYNSSTMRERSEGCTVGSGPTSRVDYHKHVGSRPVPTHTGVRKPEFLLEMRSGVSTFGFDFVVMMLMLLLAARQEVERSQSRREASSGDMFGS